ncbi:MAG: hypothetical protein WAM96_19380 [Candidatus Acidiferrales bacterium]
MNRQPRGFFLEPARIRPRQPLGDRTDGALELVPALKIVLKNAYTQWTQLRNNVLSHHSKGFRRVTRY